MKKIVDITFHYRPPHHFEAHCRLRIYRSESGESTVVMSETKDNLGMSVTNASEDIATQVTRVYGLNPERTTWVEHYPVEMWQDKMYNATWDRVEYQWDVRRAHSPRRERIGDVGDFLRSLVQ